MSAEEELGVDRDALIDKKKEVANADLQLAVLTDQAKALRAEVRAAETQVLQASREHISALKAYKTDTAEALSAQTQVCAPKP
jgi:hypothetical protein